MKGLYTEKYFWSQLPGKFVNKRTGQFAFKENSVISDGPSFFRTSNEWNETLFEIIQDASDVSQKSKGMLPTETKVVEVVGKQVSLDIYPPVSIIRVGIDVWHLLKDQESFCGSFKETELYQGTIRGSTVYHDPSLQHNLVVVGEIPHAVLIHCLDMC